MIKVLETFFARALGEVLVGVLAGVAILRMLFQQPMIAQSVVWPLAITLTGLGLIGFAIWRIRYALDRREQRQTLRLFSEFVARQQAEARRASEALNLLDRVPDLIAHVDADGRILFANQALANLPIHPPVYRPVLQPVLRSFSEAASCSETGQVPSADPLLERNFTAVLAEAGFVDADESAKPFIVFGETARKQWLVKRGPSLRILWLIKTLPGQKDERPSYLVLGRMRNVTQSSQSKNPSHKETHAF